MKAYCKIVLMNQLQVMMKSNNEPLNQVPIAISMHLVADISKEDAEVESISHYKWGAENVVEHDEKLEENKQSAVMNVHVNGSYVNAVNKGIITNFPLKLLRKWLFLLRSWCRMGVYIHIGS